MKKFFFPKNKGGWEGGQWLHIKIRKNTQTFNPTLIDQYLNS